jgi:hypothetical protein
MATRLPELTDLTLLGYNRITAKDIRQFILNSGTLKRLEMDGWPTISRNDFPGFDLNLPADDDDSEDNVPPMVFNRQYIDMIRQDND